jgi:hypothetical protein
MPKRVKAYEAIHYNVNCIQNDLSDIKCGGPQFLGFDFYVDAEEDKDDMREWLKKELHKNNKPYISIIASDVKLVKKLWTQEMMARCIKETHF